MAQFLNSIPTLELYSPPVGTVRDPLDAGQDEDELHAAECSVEDGHLGGYLLVTDVAGVRVGYGASL